MCKSRVRETLCKQFARHFSKVSRECLTTKKRRETLFSPVYMVFSSKCLANFVLLYTSFYYK